MSLALILAGLQALSGYSSSQQMIKNQIAANNKTAHGLVQQMNYSFQNYEIERQQAFASAIDSMTKMRMQAHEQESSVRAAVNEENAGGGRTADLINRSVRGDESRNADAIQENYENTQNAIDLNKNAVLVSTKNAIDSIPKVDTPSYASQLLSAASTAMQTYNAVDAIATRRKLANVGSGNPYSDTPQVMTGQLGKNYSTWVNGMSGVNLDNASKIYDATQGVDLDAASAKYDTGLFSSSSIFNSNPAYSYYSSSPFSYTGLSSSTYKGGSLWGTKSLLL